MRRRLRGPPGCWTWQGFLPWGQPPQPAAAAAPPGSPLRAGWRALGLTAAGWLERAPGDPQRDFRRLSGPCPSPDPSRGEGRRWQCPGGRGTQATCPALLRQPCPTSHPGRPHLCHPEGRPQPSRCRPRPTASTEHLGPLDARQKPSQGPPLFATTALPVTPTQSPHPGIHLIPSRGAHVSRSTAKLAGERARSALAQSSKPSEGADCRRRARALRRANQRAPRSRPLRGRPVSMQRAP